MYDAQACSTPRAIPSAACALQVIARIQRLAAVRIRAGAIRRIRRQGTVAVCAFQMRQETLHCGNAPIPLAWRLAQSGAAPLTISIAPTIMFELRRGCQSGGGREAAGWGWQCKRAAQDVVQYAWLAAIPAPPIAPIQPVLAQSSPRFLWLF